MKLIQLAFHLWSVHNELMLGGKNKSSTTFGCFSPPVMLATFAIEMGLFVYTLFRYRLTRAGQLVAFLLFFLALFQLAEYALCEDLVFSSSAWSRTGFLAITALPPLGIHLFHEVAGIKERRFVQLAYLTGLIWFLLFLIIDIFEGFGCSGNYVIFHLAPGFGFFYFIYYYVWLIVGAAISFVAGRKTKNIYRKRALYAGGIGYLSFLLPTTTINLLNPTTTEAIPSIMCGFAVLLAFILVFIVLPNHRKSQAHGRKT